MSITYIYSDEKPKEPKDSISRDEFMTSLCKTSKDNNDPKSYSYFFENLKKEIAMKKSINEMEPIEEFMFPFVEEKKDTYFHNGYLKYLLTAWKNDCGIDVDPIYIYNLILHQLCKIVNSNPEKYRSIFTREQKQIEIDIGYGFDIKKFIDELKTHIPFDVDKFVPRVPDAPPNFMDSMYGLFGEMVKTFYICSHTSCSIPKVKLCADMKKWNLINETLTNIQNIFIEKGIEEKYLIKCQRKFQEMMANINNKEYWSKFFYIKECGSGTMINTYGHIMEMLDNDKMIHSTQIPSMVSRFMFIDKVNPLKPKKYHFISGIMSSKLDENNILIPQYDCNILIPNYEKCQLSDKSIKLRCDIMECFNIFKLYDLELYRSFINGEKSNFGNYEILKDGNDTERKEKLKTEYSFWYVDQKDVVRSYEIKFDLSVDQWKRLTENNKANEDKIVTMMPEMFSFKQKYKEMELYEGIIQTGNPNIIQAFINEYKKNKYVININNLSYEFHIGDYLKSDLIDNIGNMLIHIIFFWYKNKIIPEHIKKEIIGTLIENNKEWTEYILNTFHLRIPKLVEDDIKKYIFYQTHQFTDDIDSDSEVNVYKHIPNGKTMDDVISILKRNLSDITKAKKYTHIFYCTYTVKYIEDIANFIATMVGKSLINSDDIIKKMYPETDYVNQLFVLYYFFEKMCYELDRSIYKEKNNKTENTEMKLPEIDTSKVKEIADKLKVNVNIQIAIQAEYKKYGIIIDGITKVT
ncbi:MAG: protein of unknown function DUF4419 [Edafosvirus sp.]|uniref:Uncharacterized protein n=1 Tax=Edafosvirus sp. TaxID=2487765 RepID=A0A3G4ZTL8_9VIRU|nr:MAG: protein of unknown function DUF4419 [Edafosvirus sp.]